MTGKEELKEGEKITKLITYNPKFRKDVIKKLPETLALGSKEDSSKIIFLYQGKINQLLEIKEEFGKLEVLPQEEIEKQFFDEEGSLKEEYGFFEEEELSKIEESKLREALKEYIKEKIPEPKGEEGINWGDKRTREGKYKLVKKGEESEVYKSKVAEGIEGEIISPREYLEYIETNRKSSFSSLGCIYTHNVWEGERREPVYKIHEIKFGEGNKSAFLITKPLRKIPIINQMDLEIEVADREFLESLPKPDNPKIIKKIAKERGSDLKKKTKTPSQLWYKLKQRSWEGKMDNKHRDYIFWKIAPKVKKKYLSILKNMDFNKLIRQFLYDNCEKDEDLVYIYRADFLRLSNNYRKTYLMKYNPHKIVATDTKAGKTTLGMKIGEKHDKVSIANWLGFAGASKDQVKEGKMDKEVGSHYIEEIEAEEGKDIHSKLLTFMEQGEATIDKGIKSIEDKGVPIITWHANPQLLGPIGNPKPRDIVRSFEKLIKKINQKNPLALGSRLGIIYFNHNTPRVDEEESYKSEKTRKIESIVKEIRKRAIPTIDKIIEEEEVRSWLNKDLSNVKIGNGKNFYEMVDQAIGTIRSSKIVEDVFEGLKSSEKHIRGFALKQALVDNLKQIYLGDYKIEKILDRADEHLKEACKINLESIERMSEITIDRGKYKFDQFKHFPHKAIRTIIASLIKFTKKNKDKIEKIKEAQQNWNLNRILEELSNIEEKRIEELDIYDMPSYVKRRLKRVGKYQTQLRRNFGIEIEGDKNLVLIVDKEEWFQFVKGYQKIIRGENRKETKIEEVKTKEGMVKDFLLEEGELNKEEITKEFSELEEEEVEEAIKTLIDEGSIFEPRKDIFKPIK